MPITFPEITTDVLAGEGYRSDHTLLDIRPIAAYNGWKLQNEPRGGHIPGAVSLPLRWTEYMDWVEAVDEKDLEPDEPVVIYGYSSEEAREMAEQLDRLGFKNVAVYPGFLDEWAEDPDRPLQTLSRYRQLVYPGWVQSLQEGERLEGFENEKYVLCHAHFDNYSDYEQGHIPGAVALNTNWLESPETWNRRSPDELAESLTRIGIDASTTVVLYGRYSYPTYDQDRPGQSAGQLAAMRCAAIMLYAGVEDVKILNGGLNAWEEEGYAVTQTATIASPVETFGREIPAHPEFMVDLDEARKLLDSESGDLVSVRSWPEFIGERSGYHYIEKKGRIPGAVFGNCGSDAYHMENYRNFDYTMRSFEEVVANWKINGITPDKHIAFYCGTGWRASEAFMNAYLMGWPRISVYDGGWFEWSAHPGKPVAVGEPEGSAVSQ